AGAPEAHRRRAPARGAVDPRPRRAAGLGHVSPGGAAAVRRRIVERRLARALARAAHARLPSARTHVHPGPAGDAHLPRVLVAAERAGGAGARARPVGADERARAAVVDPRAARIAHLRLRAHAPQRAGRAAALVGHRRAALAGAAHPSGHLRTVDGLPAVVGERAAFALAAGCRVGDAAD